MGQFPQSFEVYGFTIEVHAGGRRVWPPSFKRYVKAKLDSGELTVGNIMEDCNVSQSLVYKWRSDVKASRIRTTSVQQERVFSEILIEEEERAKNSDVKPDDRIHLTGQKSTMSLPTCYPVNDLVRIVLALEGEA